MLIQLVSSGLFTILIGSTAKRVDAAPVSTNSPPSTDAHYPSFSIGADGVIRRTLASSPVLPSFSSVIQAPYLSQFDGSAYAETDCGPTALAMGLSALGVPVSQLALRALADKQMGTSDPNNGTTWESLAYAAEQNGVSTFGLKNANGQGYRRWTMADLTDELAKHRPVMLLIRYWDLPDHKGSSYAGDHYIVALGTIGSGNIVYNDPASIDGSYLQVSPAQLLTAWRDTAEGIPYSAMSLYR